jgi:hypothetical protein
MPVLRQRLRSLSKPPPLADGVQPFSEHECSWSDWSVVLKRSRRYPLNSTGWFFGISGDNNEM